MAEIVTPPSRTVTPRGGARPLTLFINSQVRRPPAAATFVLDPGRQNDRFIRMIRACVLILSVGRAVAGDVDGELGAAYKPAGVPPDLKTVLDRESAEEIIQYGLSKIHQKLGSAFPNLIVRGPDGHLVRLSRIVDRDIAVLLELVPCDQGFQYIDWVKSNEWKIADRDVVFLVLDGSTALNHSLRTPRRRGLVLETQWPLEDYLAYIRFYPIVYLIGPHLEFQGFMWGAQHEITRPGDPVPKVDLAAQRASCPRRKKEK